MKTYALVLFLIGTVSVSCQKDNDGDLDDNKTKTELITASTWRFDQAQIDADKNGTPDGPVPAGFLEACVTDNTLTLKSDGTGTLDEGATRCDPADPQSTSISWEFKDGETVLSSASPIFGGMSGDAKITALTATKLQLQKAMDVPVLGSVNIILDLKH